VAGYKINLEKSIDFLYTNNEHIEKEHKNTTPFTTVSKKTIHLGINLAKNVNDFYKENCKPLKKEFEEDYRRWNDLPCLCISRINIVKLAILPKAMYMFNSVPIKIPMTFITEIENSDLSSLGDTKDHESQYNTE
jgi:hypothetical protein